MALWVMVVVMPGQEDQSSVGEGGESEAQACRLLGTGVPCACVYVCVCV